MIDIDALKRDKRPQSAWVVHALIDRLDAAEADALEQARLNGMGAERELALMAKLEAAENDAAHQKALAESALRVAEGWERKCDSLRAKIEQMERQEPVAKVESWTNGSYTRHYKLKWLRDVDEGAALYALPVIAPKLDEIKTALQRALELGQRETWAGARKHRSREDQREEQQCWNKVWSLLGAKGEEK